MIRIGLDVHGVVDTTPHFFSTLSKLLVKNGHEVHILTGAEHTSSLENHLRENLKLSWTHFFSITSFHKNSGTEITYIDGNPYMDNKIWNRAKSEYCRIHGIHLHIDDSDIYGKYFSTPYARYLGINGETVDQNNPPTERPYSPSTGTDSDQQTDLEDDLSNYNDSRYKKPSVTVDIVICTIMNGALQVLLIKRKYPPFRNHRAIPGGFLDIEKNESLEEAAARELEEETGLRYLYIEQLKTYGDVDRDPRTRVITTAYFSLVPTSKIEEQTILANSDAEDAKWYSLQNFEKELGENNEKPAFDHGQILKDLRTRLKGKISYTPIAFELLPDQFTWTELRTVYEAVLNKKIDPANFKKKIKSLYKIKVHKARKNVTAAGRPPVFISFEGVRDMYI